MKDWLRGSGARHSYQVGKLLLLHAAGAMDAASGNSGSPQSNKNIEI